MTMTTTPSLPQTRKRAFEKKAVYNHDHHPYLFTKRITFEKKAVDDQV